MRVPFERASSVASELTLTMGEQKSLVEKSKYELGTYVHTD
jgi:hypothetical protein